MHQQRLALRTKLCDENHCYMSNSMGLIRERRWPYHLRKELSLVFAWWVAQQQHHKPELQEQSLALPLVSLLEVVCVETC
jgi:hypothetical protein